MQDALLALTRYWTDRGAMVVQPFNTEVGAGTLNPATVLRVLGPEPWRVAYVEPSVRPDDARYGENPNRLQTHTQFQVILKPDPGDPQELYLGSLEALGIDVPKVIVDCGVYAAACPREWLLSCERVPLGDRSAPWRADRADHQQHADDQGHRRQHPPAVHLGQPHDAVEQCGARETQRA
jgi:hypothetical protein